MVTDAPQPEKRSSIPKIPNPKDIIDNVESHVDDAVSEVKDAFTTLKDKADDLVPTGDFSQASTINVEVGATGTKSPSPWGDAVNMQTVDGVTVWCIDCGMHGDLLVSGSFSMGLTEPS